MDAVTTTPTPAPAAPAGRVLQFLAGGTTTVRAAELVDERRVIEAEEAAP